MGLADLLGIADLECRKVKSAKWLKRKLRAILGGQFPLSFSGGRLEFVTKAFGDSLKLSSTGLAIQ
jgi:hypothetical protein